MRKRFEFASLAAALLLGACSSSGVGEAVTASSVPGPADQLEVVIQPTDFQIAFRLDGESIRSEVIGLVANPGLVFEPSIPWDSEVAEGDSIGTVVVDPAVEAALEVASQSSNIDLERLRRLRSEAGPRTAPVSGVLTLADETPVMISPGIDVIVDLNPIQALRLQSVDISGRAGIETVAGRREVACKALWTEVPELGDSDAPTGRTRLHCRLPDHIETAPGLRAQLLVESGVFEDALVVPNVYIGYDDETDSYFVVIRADSGTERIPIEVGPTDGVVRVIESGASAGAELVPPGEG